MKMIKSIIVLLLCTMFVSGCSVQESNKDNTNLNEYINEISYEELQEKLLTEDDFILYIGRPDCGDCQQFQPILEEYLDQNKTEIFYVNIKSFRDAALKEDASQEEVEFYESIRENIHFNWTPTLNHISNGKYVSTYTYLDEAYYEIEDTTKQESVKEEFNQAFYDWMEENK